MVAIEQNGETQATEKSGRSGALPWIGEGHYRTTFRMTTLPNHVELVFDGAMSEPVVKVNGSEVGRWAYGYNAFRVDITTSLVPGDNVIEVDLINVEESSRWYPGGGLYRPVELISYPRGYMDDWQTCIRTLSIQDGKALLSISAFIPYVHDGETLTAKLLDKDGTCLIQKSQSVGESGAVVFTMEVANPQLWSPETPYLYNMLLETNTGDCFNTRFGIRTITVSKEGGFQLNGVTRKLKGVCLHHDLGPLGAAINKAALIRQIKTMKEMGADAIRTSHNMPSQWQMDICDSLGMMVMAESFDMWLYPKCKNGYARFFNEWSDRDITNLVLAHRNHPSIIMWSIGNEIPEQWSEEGVRISRRLQNLCHQYDPSRPVTQGMDRAEAALKSGFAQVMDVPGFNYRVHKYENNIKQLPQGFLLGSETASTVSSRGVYKFPVVAHAADQPASTPALAAHRQDGQCSSYDVEYCSWSNLPDDDWRWQDDEPWVIGEFVWTGFDYLGEPTPYDNYWPSRSSYFGICDLAGLPKDRYYLYRSHWNKQEHTIHLLPHWTWPGRKGQVTPVYCYTDYPEAELFVNGKSQGRIRKNNMKETADHKTNLDRYRLRWNEVRYEPGEVRVVVYDEAGKPAGEKTIRTAGKADHLKMEGETFENLVFVTVSMVDKDGTLCPDAADQLEFTVEGDGAFKAVCNGDATSLEPFTQPRMCLFHGQLVVIVEKKGSGNITLTARNKQFSASIGL